MTAPEAEPGFRAIDPPESTWENRVAGRIMLVVGSYRPYAKFPKLRMPVLVQTCERDATTPSAPAVKAAERSPNAELIRYEIGHFDIYVGRAVRAHGRRPARVPHAEPPGYTGSPASRPAGPPVPAR